MDKSGAIQLNWLIDWPNEQVFFYVKNAFDLTTDHNFFYLGFSQRGNVPDSDLCLFQRHGLNDIVTVSSSSSSSFCSTLAYLPAECGTAIKCLLLSRRTDGWLVM